ncbi:DNA-3-methyladenine glycosylase 2 [Microlunatus ginsengisoli]|uniref:DNA-3-methyladenine glycosylase II n=1 Tax=Microlunatus ginsengisoli TaxID=363863 RepID=A0ABP6ZTQ3_9ACTN
MTVLPANGAFDAETALGYLVRHAIPGIDRIESERRSLTRLLPSSAGPVPTTVMLHSDGVTATLVGSAHDPPADVLGLVGDWFDLGTDLEAVGRVLDQDPVLADIGRVRPGLRVLGFPEPFEATVVTVLGQQVSVRAAGTFAGRLAAAYGHPGPAGLTRFPEPRRLADVPVDELQSAVGVTGARARTLRAVARLFADGFVLARGPDVRTALLATPGIGPWTTDYLAMRVLHDQDACPASDLVLRRALGQVKPAAVLERAEHWRPFRAYAVMRLWTAALSGLPTEPTTGRTSERMNELSEARTVGGR